MVEDLNTFLGLEQNSTKHAFFVGLRGNKNNSDELKSLKSENEVSGCWRLQPVFK
jgi:hypothetical protein